MRNKITPVLLVGVLLLGSASTQADTIYLQDGSKRQGKIVRETDQSVILEEISTTGKSLGRTTISKIQIERIKLSSPEEVTFKQLQRYRLDPNASYSLEQYDPVLALFQKFVADYPGSVYAIEVRSWIGAWEHEKAQVARGLVKISDPRLPHAYWMTQTQAQPFLARDQLVAQVQRTEALWKQHNAQLAATKARKDQFVKSAGILQPAQRDQGSRTLDEEISRLTNLVTEDEHQYKAALDILQKWPDPLAPYRAAEIAKRRKNANSTPVQHPSHSPAPTNDSSKTSKTGSRYQTIVLALLAAGTAGGGLYYFLRSRRRRSGP